MAHHSTHDFGYNECFWNGPSPGGGSSSSSESGTPTPFPFTPSPRRVSDALSDPLFGASNSTATATATATPSPTLWLQTPLLSPPTRGYDEGGLSHSSALAASVQAEITFLEEQGCAWESAVRDVQSVGERLLQDYRTKVVACLQQVSTQSEEEEEEFGCGVSAIRRVRDGLQNLESRLTACLYENSVLSNLLSASETDPPVAHRPANDATVAPKPSTPAFAVTPDHRANGAKKRRLPPPPGTVHVRKRKATKEMVAPEEEEAGGDGNFAAGYEAMAAKPARSLYEPLLVVVERADLERHVRDHPNDVLGGHGGSGNHNSGDQNYRKLAVARLKELILRSSGVRPTKAMIDDLGRRVVDEVQHVRGGRFLELVTYGALAREGWQFDEPIDDPKRVYGRREKPPKKTLEKVKQYIREQLHSLLDQHQSPLVYDDVESDFQAALEAFQGFVSPTGSATDASPQAESE